MGSLGFGAAPIGNLYRPVPDTQALDAVAAAVNGGIRYFDTAPFYGFGLSEKRLGAALGEIEKNDSVPELIVSTKVGRCLNPVAKVPSGIRHGFASTETMEPYFDYSYDGVMRAFESSQQRLQSQRIDVLLAHDLGEVTHGPAHGETMREFLDGGYRAMEELKSQGLVRALGVGANEWQVGMELLAHTDIDCFLLAGRYTLLDQGAALKFLPACASRDVSVILGGPFNSGILATGVSRILATGVTQKTEDAVPRYDYAPACREIIHRVARLEALCAEFQIDLAAAALQFPLASPVVCTVLAGFTAPGEVTSALKSMNQKIPVEFWRTLKAVHLIEEYAEIPEAP